MLKSLATNWLALSLTLPSPFVDFDYLFQVDVETLQASTKVLPLEEEEPKNMKRIRKHHSKKKKLEPMDPMTVSSMYFDEETYIAVATYNDATPYSLYKDDIVFYTFLPFQRQSGTKLRF